MEKGALIGQGATAEEFYLLALATRLAAHTRATSASVYFSGGLVRATD